MKFKALDLLRPSLARVHVSKGRVFASKPLVQWKTWRIACIELLGCESINLLGVAKSPS